VSLYHVHLSEFSSVILYVPVHALLADIGSLITTFILLELDFIIVTVTKASSGASQV